MAYRLLRHIGKIEQSDDNAALLDLLYLSPGSAFRVSEFGGQDGFFLISNEGTTVTATNGTYLRANSTVCLLYTSPSPRDKRQSRMPSSA